MVLEFWVAVSVWAWWCVQHKMFSWYVNTLYVSMCMCLCVWCVTQWVSWVCWRCLPKLRCGWHFSTNPASLEGLLILTTQFFPCSLLLYQRERMRPKQVHRLCVHSFCTCISQAEINLLTSPQRLHANALPTPKCHASSNSVLPSFVPPFVIRSLSFRLSFPPLFLSYIPPISLQRCTADVSSQGALCTSECHK